MSWRARRAADRRRDEPGHRLALALVAVAAFLGSCGERREIRLLALSDEIARTCAELGLRMAQSWTAMEEARGRRVSYAEVDLGHLDGARARCQGALRLVEEIAAEPQRTPKELKASLDDLVVLDRLLLESIVDPNMDRAALAATVYGFGESYQVVRGKLGRELPLSEIEQKRIVGGLLPRWQELTPPAVAPL